MSASTLEQAITVRDRLEHQQARIVLAESCTAGRIASVLGELPGISTVLCGSFVIYRNDSKARWLGISRELLDDPEIGPVSAQVSERLALAALDRTPEAEYSLAVTGDIGPGAPPESDGRVFCCLAKRAAPASRRCVATLVHLASPAPQAAQDIAARAARLDEATRLALSFLAHQL